ncbi:hypothetical protein [Streptomyces albireticuli]|uniref:hypothetical protein n=1 Tax=Streptomyces albireticuli TaxID=1940 RepID=UPI00117BE966|nr:hypothetical protein [Streptomyces albireticuli]MCD9166223.1 hypothetical protein [Streptomyces albireticuli]MCD9196542.1 hypothetical protein [Streptomyces albireticuli]
MKIRYSAALMLSAGFVAHGLFVNGLAVADQLEPSENCKVLYEKFWKSNSLEEREALSKEFEEKYPQEVEECREYFSR